MVLISYPTPAEVQMLHDSLLLSSGGLSRAKVVGRQISHEVQQLQKRIAEQERVLGSLANLREVPSSETTNGTLWWTNIAMENHHAINGKIHYFYGHFQLLC